MTNHIGLTSPRQGQLSLFYIDLWPGFKVTAISKQRVFLKSKYKKYSLTAQLWHYL